MKLQTQIPLEKSTNQIDYKSKVLLLGSCFSENIGSKFSYFKFQTLQNPFGILFHPAAIKNLIERAIHQKKYTEQDVFFLNERWHCFDAHSALSSSSKEELVSLLNGALENTFVYLKNATHICITLGTAWVYKHKENQAVVANCHKVPQGSFNKELLSIEGIIGSLENIQALVSGINPELRFIYTVSPVRHLKDGFVENQRSKSHLLVALHQHIENSNRSDYLWYFPSYELMMDELRDYRFYTSDMVHPSQVAIAYIWEKFKYVAIARSAYETMEKVDSIQKGLAHRAFNPDSENHQKFLTSINVKIKNLKKVNSFIDFKTLEE